MAEHVPSLALWSSRLRNTFVAQFKVFLSSTSERGEGEKAVFIFCFGLGCDFFHLTCPSHLWVAVSLQWWPLEVHGFFAKGLEDQFLVERLCGQPGEIWSRETWHFLAHGDDCGLLEPNGSNKEISWLPEIAARMNLVHRFSAIFTACSKLPGAFKTLKYTSSVPIYLAFERSKKLQKKWLLEVLLWHS